MLGFTGPLATIADPTARLQASKSAAAWSRSIDNDEFYVIPEAVIGGG